MVARNQSKKDVGGHTTSIKRFRPSPFSYPLLFTLEEVGKKTSVLRSVVYLHKTISRASVQVFCELRASVQVFCEKI